jgi:hypothetical protein
MSRERRDVSTLRGAERPNNSRASARVASRQGAPSLLGVAGSITAGPQWPSMLYVGATAGIYRTCDGGGRPRRQQPGAHFEDWRPSEGSDNAAVSPSRGKIWG